MHITRRITGLAATAAAVAGLLAGGIYTAASATAATAFPIPAGRTVTATTATGVTLGWSPVAGSQGYHVQVASANSGTVTDDERTGPVSSLGVSGLAPGTAYEWRIATGAVAGGELASPWSAWEVFFTLAAGGTGPPGPPGPAGPAGPQGPSGITSATVTDLGGIASVPTGGPFNANSTQVGTVKLDAGTYELCLNAKATPPAGGTGTVQVFPQFFVYLGAHPPMGFAGDLFNVGAGALESGSHGTIDSYYSGCSVLTLGGGEVQAVTLHVYSFGYNSDQSAGSYILDDLSITAVALAAQS